MISDPKGRPVYTEAESTFGSRWWKVWLRNEKTGEYCAEDAHYQTVEELLADYPLAVKHVERRLSPPKKRHPDMHYAPTRRAARCLGRPGATLTSDQCLNARTTTDISQVTCRHCLAAVEEIVRRRIAQYVLDRTGSNINGGPQ
jgi:hypothetical protein